jgi:hypothetical protein
VLNKKTVSQSIRAEIFNVAENALGDIVVGEISLSQTGLPDFLDTIYQTGKNIP